MLGVVSTTWSDYFVGGLLSWHRANKRDFPWRKKTNPYNTLLSEIMLQRTPARQVEPVYLQFVAEFADPLVLAAASVDEIESVLYPLGLAHRGSRIKRMAEQIRDKHEGVVPDDIGALMDLVGVGPYVAAAVFSFGFGHNTAVVDANVARVTTRFFSFTPKTARAHTDRDLWSFCQGMLPPGRGPDFNYAILDFAAAICTARKPQHDRCPVKDHCEFHCEVG